MISNIYFEPRKVKVPRRVGKIIDVAIGDMFTFVLNGKWRMKWLKSWKNEIDCEDC